MFFDGHFISILGNYCLAIVIGTADLGEDLGWGGTYHGRPARRHWYRIFINVPGVTLLAVMDLYHF